MFCRPVQFEFAEETPEKISITFNDMEEQIEALRETVIEEAKIQYKLIPSSMIDGKVTET